MRGLLIVIEGGDATGKATQAKLLVQRLVSEFGYKAYMRSFPRYESIAGRLVGRHLTSKSAWMDLGQSGVEGCDSLDDATVLQALMMIDRVEVAEDIRQWIDEGHAVVCDRWSHSSFVYGGLDGVDLEWTERCSRVLPQAHLNVLIDLDPEVAMRRRPVPRDRYEDKLDFRAKARKAYCKIWDPHLNAKDREWTAVDGSLSADLVHKQIWSKVQALVERRREGKHK